MSKLARLYIGLLIGTAVLLTATGLRDLGISTSTWLTMAAATAIASVAQLWHAHAPGHRAYHPAIVIHMAGAMLLPPGLYALMIIVSHAIEWAKARLTGSTHLAEWYLQPLNMAAHIASGLAAAAVIRQVTWSVPSEMDLRWGIAGSAACLVYAALNHLIIGLAVVFIRGVAWRDARSLNIESLATDLVMLLLGQVVAFLWVHNRWLAIPALSPLLLIYRALLVPQLKQEARTDAKTGLLNTRHFRRELETELSRAERTLRPLSIVMSDLDMLRNINNTYGHLAGDQVLCAVSAAIRNLTRRYDTAARFGGEEFVILLPETNFHQAHAFAERLRSSIESLAIPVRTSDTPIHVTISVGVASFPDDGVTANDLIHQADLAVYQAKLNGRNRVVCASHLSRTADLMAMP